MYAQTAFQLDRTASLAFAAARGFGLVTGWDGVRPVASPLPFDLAYRDDGAPRIEFHVARNNPLLAALAHGAPLLVAVMGADAYVSPHWYVSPDQVPTWLYETVHLSGPARMLSPARLRAHVERLSARFEASLAPKPAWTAGGLTPGRREAMLRAIVGVEIDVESVEGSAKLNQHKADCDHAAVVAGLRTRGDPHADTIAARMVALRPDLAYETSAQDDHDA